ncbi:hypothetical protein MTP04_02520 [Lysinibacillus sp. PLM2]|nr:hypothetical protein MTP04_02520 [Lysinibacillus sp. PLM2]
MGVVEMKRYYLFTSDSHEKIRLDFPSRTIKAFIDYWNKGYSSKLIGRKLGLKQIEIALIAMDLEFAGEITARPGGIFGTVEKEVS